MKKYLASLLCFTMLLSTIIGSFAISAGTVHADDSNMNVVYAKSITADPAKMVTDINTQIWGEPTITVDGNSYNTSYNPYEGFTPDGYEASYYFRWDSEYMYIGMTSPDTYLAGCREDNETYTGDSLQFWIEPRVSKITQGGSFSIGIISDGSVSIRDHGTVTGNINNDNANIYKNVIHDSENGVLKVMLAIPHTDLGYTAEEIKEGASYAVRGWRVSATADSKYAGWLAWGDSVVVLTEDSLNQVEAPMITADPAKMVTDINTQIWGEPTITVDGNSYNTSYNPYEGFTPDGYEASYYFRWDSEYMYIGMTSPDTYLAGCREDNETYTGDSLQFWIEPRVSKITQGGSFSIGIISDGSVSIRDHGTVTGNINNDNANIYKNVIHDSENGVLKVMLAIPHTDLGYTAEEIKEGASYAVRGWRVSATAESKYAGWLAWGDSVVVLTNPAALDQDEESENINLLGDIVDATGYTHAGPWEKRNNILRTEKGTFVADLTKYEIVAAASGYGDEVMHEFTLSKLDEGTGKAKEMGYGYLWDGNIDLLGDSAGNPYIVSGYSSYATSAQILYPRDPDEMIILQAFAYNEENGLLMNYANHRDLEEGLSKVSYWTSAMDAESNTIYSAYTCLNEAGETVLVVYRFDIAAKRWTDDVTQVVLEAAPDNYGKKDDGSMGDLAARISSEGYLFVGADGFKLVYGAGSDIYTVTADGAQKLGTGRLEDAYKAADGSLHILYQAPDAGTYTLVTGSSSKDSAISAAADVVLTELAGTVYAVAATKDTAATVSVFKLEGESFGQVKDLAMNAIIQYNGSLMIARRNNGSVESDKILTMLTGKLGVSQGWYWANVPIQQ